MDEKGFNVDNSPGKVIMLHLPRKVSM